MSPWTFRTIFLIVLVFPTGVSAKPFRLCTQNMARFGEIQLSNGQAERQRAKEFARVFSSVDCQLIALQEIYSDPWRSGEQLFHLLKSKLEHLSQQRYRMAIQRDDSRKLALGYLWNESAIQSVRVHPIPASPLPVLALYGRPRNHLRVPLVLDGVLEGQYGQTNRIILINMHLKSQRHFPPDPAGLGWEGYRMEMAESVRGYVEKAIESRSYDLVVVLGDRNSPPTSASAHILEGKLTLQSFKMDPGCAVLDDRSPECGWTPKSSILKSAFEHKRYLNEMGSYFYQKSWRWLDDILYWKSENHGVWIVKSSVRKIHPSISDHQLLVAQLPLNL